MANPRRISGVARRRTRRTAPSRPRFEFITTRPLSPPPQDDDEIPEIDPSEEDREEDREEELDEEESSSSSTSTEDPPSIRPLREDLRRTPMSNNFSSTRSSRGRGKSKLPLPPTHVKANGWRWLWAEDKKTLIKVNAEFTLPIHAISFIKTDGVKGSDSSNSIGPGYMLVSESCDAFVEEDEYNRIRAMILPNEQRPEPTTHRPQNALYGMEIT